MPLSFLKGDRMEPLINPIIFWIAQICGGISSTALIIMSVLGIGLFAFGFCYLINLGFEELEPSIKKAFKVGIIGLIISAVLYLFVPTKETIYTSIAASYITPENVDSFTEFIERGIDHVAEQVGVIVNKENQ